jgi:protein-S-isoprenylcysteine O-methyltransferase Ste14
MPAWDLVKISFLILGSIMILWVPRHSLLHVRQHGFYRFLAWQTILIAFVVNVDYWFVDPFSTSHLIAWGLLILSLVVIILAVRAFRRLGGIDPQRMDPGLVGIEKTTRLVTSGIYHYIRHPFYSSLLFLSWGIYLKHISQASSLLTLLATLFLFATAAIEEHENLAYFGQAYQEYMDKTRRFIPFLV